MVDTEMVIERVLRGAYVGAGAFAAGFADQAIRDNVMDSDLASGFGQVAIGLGTSVGADMVFDANTIPNDALEFAGYGFEGAGFSDLGAAAASAGSTREVVVEEVESGGAAQQASATTTVGQ